MSGKLEIGLKRTWFSPGDTMQGVVYLDVRDEPVEASRLTMRISGWEKAVVAQAVNKKSPAPIPKQSPNDSSRPDKIPEKVVKYAEKKVLINHYFNLCKFPERQVDEGQYEFPFSLVIPDNLPNSFYKERQVTAAEISKAKIRYKLTVELDTNDLSYKDSHIIKLIKSSIGRNIFALSSKINLAEFTNQSGEHNYDDQTPKSAQIPKTSGKMELSSCCSGKRVCKVTARLEKPEFNNHEQIVCLLDIENKTGQEIRTIEVQLIQVVSMEAAVDKDNSAFYSFEDKLVTKNFGPYAGSQVDTVKIDCPPLVENSCQGALVGNMYVMQMKVYLAEEGFSFSIEVPIYGFPLVNRMNRDSVFDWDAAGCKKQKPLVCEILPEASEEAFFEKLMIRNKVSITQMKSSHPDYSFPPR
jgi:hypothetical protein